MQANQDHKHTAKLIQAVVFDVDGVLTDGRIIYTDDGHELKQFHVQDGASIKLMQKHGIRIGIITGRRSPMVARRARELGIADVLQGVSNKAQALDQLIAQGFPGEHIAAVGDDLQDIEIFSHPAVSLKISVPNGHPATQEHADLITQRTGGSGVAVDIAQYIISARGEWEY